MPQTRMVLSTQAFAIPVASAWDCCTQIAPQIPFKVDTSIIIGMERPLISIVT